MHLNALAEACLLISKIELYAGTFVIGFRRFNLKL